MSNSILLTSVFDYGSAVRDMCEFRYAALCGKNVCQNHRCEKCRVLKLLLLSLYVGVTGSKTAKVLSVAKMTDGKFYKGSSHSNPYVRFS